MSGREGLASAHASPDRAAIEFFLVQGSETAMHHQLMSGHVPRLVDESLKAGIWWGVGLLVLAWVLFRVLVRYRPGPRVYTLARLALFVGFFLA